MAVKQNLENTRSTRFILNSKTVSAWVFFTLAVPAMNNVVSAASACVMDRKPLEKKTQSGHLNVKPHLGQKYSSTLLLSQRVTQYLTEYVTGRKHKKMLEGTQ